MILILSTQQNTRIFFIVLSMSEVIFEHFSKQHFIDGNGYEFKLINRLLHNCKALTMFLQTKTKKSHFSKSKPCTSH